MRTQQITLHSRVKYVYLSEDAGRNREDRNCRIYSQDVSCLMKSSQDLGCRPCRRNELLLEVDFHMVKQPKQILEKVISTHGATATAEVLDANKKAMGYKLSTRAAMTVSISDMTVPPQKPEMIKNAQDTVDKI